MAGKWYDVLRAAAAAAVGVVVKLSSNQVSVRHNERLNRKLNYTWVDEANSAIARLQPIARRHSCSSRSYSHRSSCSHRRILSMISGFKNKLNQLISFIHSSKHKNNSLKQLKGEGELTPCLRIWMGALLYTLCPPNPPDDDDAAMVIWWREGAGNTCDDDKQ